MSFINFKYSNEILNWFNHGKESMYVSDNFCENRFIFNSRLNSFKNILNKNVSESCLYLILASIGEIGNNCFDHNLGPIFTYSNSEIFKLGLNPKELASLNNQGVLTILSW